MKKDRLAFIKEKYRGAAERIKQAPESTNDKLAATTRYKYADRWIERTREIGRECDRWDQIAFDDPQISLEWKLCDPANLVLIQNKKTRQGFIDSLTEEERAYLCSDPDA